jgi:UDP-GlcNAc:undecaprenyl-phosphate/decaprenyl-phosphate GlcNAc-1-phosphate transferase
VGPLGVGSGAGRAPVTVAAPLLVYTADVALTLVRRAKRGAPLSHAHHEHVYQRLVEITRSHGAATGGATMATVLCAAIGLWNLFVPGAIAWPDLHRECPLADWNALSAGGWGLVLGH